MKALALLGSPRRDGNTDLLAGEVLRGCAEAGMEVEKVYLADLNLHPPGPLVDEYDQREDLHPDDDWRPLMDRLLAAQVLVLASPVYWQGVSAQFKCFADRWSCYYAAPWLREGLRGKIWVTLTAYANSDPQEGEWVLGPMRIWVRHWRGELAGELGVSVRRWGAVRELPEALSAAHDLGRRAAELAARR